MDERTRHDLEALYVEGAGMDAWAERITQPLSALRRPSSPDDERVPLVDMRWSGDLDAIVSGLFADDAPGRAR